MQNCAVYEFNELPMIDGMVIATCLTDCHMNTVIDHIRWTHPHSSLEYLFFIPPVHKEYPELFWTDKIQALD